MRIIVRTFVYLMWIFIMGFFASRFTPHDKLFAILIIIGGIFYLRTAMDWEEERIKNMAKRKQL